MKKHLQFIIPSILGIVLFLVPFTIGEDTTILFGHAKNVIDGSYHDVLVNFGLVLMFSTIVLSLLGSLVFKEKFSKNSLLKGFIHSPVWLIITILGAITYILVYFEIGFEQFYGDLTGQVILHDIIPGLLVTFIVANIILPLLMDFGLLDVLGALLSKVMRKLFRVPGKSAIDAVSSFVGDGTLGILITDDQYVKGNYTRREAILIATGFSVVGIASVAYVASALMVENHFLSLYLIVILTSIAIAFIVARLPIMKRYKDENYDGSPKKDDDNITLKEGYANALNTASNTMQNLSVVYKNILSKIMSILFGLVPVIMVIGTFVLLISEYTEFFNILSTPIVPVLDLLQIPNAKEIAPAMLAGFGDMFVPLFMFDPSTIHIKALFFTSAMVLVQLIFLSETGTVLMKAKFKLSFLEVLGFFLLRTIIALPIIALLTHLLAFMGVL